MSLQTTSSGCFRPVGTKSFGRLRQKPEAFDQQPVEASATISACLAAWRADDGAEWPMEALRAFEWFLGENDLQTALIDPDTGSCSDGLHPDRPNENKGAESVLSYLLGLVEIRQFKRMTAMDRTKPASKLSSRRHRHDPTSNNPREHHCPHSEFMNRQSLYLRPDPARVVVRPFKPATEPETSTRPIRSGQSYRRPGTSARCRSCRATIERCARKFRRPPQESARYFRSARRGDGGRARTACSN